MKILLIFTLCLISGALVSRYVTAYTGTRINIKCRYEDEYKDKPKSFYKIETDQWSFDRIRTKPDSEWSHDGRFSIHDNRSAGFFSVFIRELNTEDTGTYGCAVVVSDETEIYTVVKLNVTEGLSHEKSISETVYVGADLTVSCNYPESHRNDNKFLCNRIATAACSYTLTVKENSTNVKKGHFSLYDDREKHIVTASLKNVTEQDSGEYWCGAEVNWKSDRGYKVYFKRINLEVTRFPAFTVIVVSVFLLLLLLSGMIFLIVTLHKRRKMQDPKTMTQTSGETNGDHENNPNVLPLQSTQTANLPESAYQRLDPKTNQSDSVYQSLNITGNQSDSVYCSLNLTSNQSDSGYGNMNLNTN
ncbi:hypothetical protein QTP86_033276 [Hemibagrus guttatus]|nr:hypothetical protein QTP86_033276 [Hemibagrus guttatus]